jgi:hypothetical protein
VAASLGRRSSAAFKLALGGDHLALDCSVRDAPAPPCDSLIG